MTATDNHPKSTVINYCFSPGDRVRISKRAFPSSLDDADVHARGQEATLRWPMDDDEEDELWEAQLETGEASGTVVCPLRSEMTPITR